MRIPGALGWRQDGALLGDEEGRCSPVQARSERLSITRRATSAVPKVESSDSSD